MISNDDSSFVSKRGHEYGVHHLLATKPGTVIDVISHMLQWTQTKTQSLLELGAIYHNHQRCCGNSVVEKSDYLRVHGLPRRYDISDLDLKKVLVADEENFVVVKKPSGIPVHPTVDNQKENLVTVLSEMMQQPLFVTHRLDVPTEGLMVFAKTKDFQTKFNRFLSEGHVHKIYRAVVFTQQLPNSIQSGVSLVHFMEPAPRAPKNVSATDRVGWQKCVLTILEKTQISDKLTELKIQLETGRTHQIRAQLSAEGCPIVGDVMYGSTRSLSAERIFLQSAELWFPDDFHFELGQASWSL